MTTTRLAGGLACHVEGAGPPLVLLHGGMGSWTHWSRNIPALRAHFTVHAPDLPGCGDSPSVPDDIPRDVYVGQVCAALSGIAGGAPLRVAGFSFGAIIAAMVAARTPGTIAKLALLAPGGFGAAAGRKLELRKLPTQPASEAERREVLRHNLMLTMFAEPESADQVAIDLQRDNVARARYDSRRFSLTTNTIDALEHVDAPTLAVFAERDNLAWPSVHPRIESCRRVKPDIRIEVAPGCGHWIPYEAAPLVNRLLIEFLSHSEETL
ncbi:MAG: alpha/beta hydrolase [Burkholderiales bacterium]|nr:alpha/beta hydrolase [Burkholderiales bacterium]